MTLTDKLAPSSAGMDTDFFFKVWGVYQAHWGIQEQEALYKIHTAKLLRERLVSSSKMRALCYMHHILSVMWEMQLFTRPDEIFTSIQDMADACLGEESDDSCKIKIHPFDRMRDSIHLPPPEKCKDIYTRQWEYLRRPIISNAFDHEESLYRVSALVALL
jgi:hypothetical protein